MPMQFLLSPPEKPPVRFAKFASSVVAHIAVAALAIALSRYAAANYEELAWSRYTIEPLRLHESVPIFFAPSPEKAALGATAAIAPGGGGRKAGPTILE